MTKSISTKFTENEDRAQEPFSKQEHRQKPIRLILVLGLILASGIVYIIWHNQPQQTANILKLSGRIDGYETEIGVKRSGRIESISVREGVAVKKGQQLIKLDDSDDQLLKDQLLSAEAKIASAQSDVEQARSNVEQIIGEVEEMKNRIGEAQLNLQQSFGDAQGKIEQARSNVAAARSQLAQAQAQVTQAEAELRLAQVNRDRYAQLVNDGAINRQQFDQAQTTLDTAIATLAAYQATVHATREQLNATLGSFTQAKTTGLNPSIRNSQLAALYSRKKQSYAQIKAAQAQVKSAQAKVRDALATRQQIYTQIKDSQKDLNLISPLDGVVIARSAEPGAVVNNQTKILTIVDPKALYLRGFVPEGDIGKVRVGQQTKIFLDSAPKRPLEGKVISIDPQASFTPENIYFQKDRVRQVVGVRISIENPSGCFQPEQPYTDSDLPCPKIGMPGDAEIKLRK
ncbi:HlyD family efflux transporter periplasmic adaptor subunit [Nostoc sp. UIC 10630]|uniref:HlyD family secretion protein n=1 Tax=Nostoc sp. UIC 10630 TaxID=2100146 RepID=UPI0013D08E9D|nr:HlyD family efflux transporter periplasmic adaptor subunit [Nostoc sp. UIC 10630]NEU78541.1 HlyD family efflux transporter periplasmic adaptor subunit [Nostoc sp. UIC 10630]